MTLAGSEYFPDLGAWTHEEVRSAGYHRRSVSVFDHWLSPEEVRACKLLSYSDALEAGLVTIYEEQELRFLRFYQELFAGSVFRRAGVGRLKRTVVFHKRWDRRLKKDVKRSLRDHRYMEVFVPTLSVRVEGNWDRTDVLLFQHMESVPAVTTLAAKHGLFLI
ncbi:MAG: hypothetical protein LH466_01485 [Sphingomonas bacterium]|nr:hypothetical protein [Sphingomonas bacterium]